ncbi:hypothetical protein IVB50_41040 [Bradyrhizobium sp. 87]|nr:hypothetical protein [Bradyrhizobium sp. 87]
MSDPDAVESTSVEVAEHLTRMDFIVLDELGYLPFAEIRQKLISRLSERPSIIVANKRHPATALASSRCQDNDRTAASTV